MRLYVYAPQFHLRPKNTDWLYNKTLPRISEFNPNVEVYLQQSLATSLEYNGRVAAEIVKGRLRLPVPAAWLPEMVSRFNVADVRRSKADLIYGHAPSNVDFLPLMNHTGPIFEDVLRQRGVPESQIEREKSAKRQAMDRAQLVTLHSEAAAETLRALSEHRADRVRVLPFFLPHLKFAMEQEVAAKFERLKQPGSTLKLLFVGREAKRKGLENLIDAFKILNQKIPGRLQLDVITSFADGSVDVPTLPNLKILPEADRATVAAKMREAHIFAMPSRFETFGLVYLEAMAAGAIALAPNHPTQQEILQDGSAGLLVAPSAEAIVSSLTPLLSHPDAMLQLALSGWRRANSTYHPGIIARQFEELGNEAKELFKLDQR